MAAPADVSARSVARPGEEIEQLRTQLNALITAVRTLATKLDADATVTDTNYFLLTMDSAAGGPSKVNNLQ